MTVLSSQLNNKLSKMNGKTIYVPSYIFGLGLLFLSFSSISFTLDKNKEVSFFKKRITFLKIKIYEKVEGNLAFTGMGSGCATLLANLNAIGTVPDPTIAYVDNNPPFGCGSETMYPSPLVSAEQSGSFATAFCVPTPLPYRGLDESFQVVVGGDLIIPSTGGAEIEGRAAIGGNIQVNRTPYGIAESGGGTYVIGAAGDAVGVSGTINGTGALSLGANNSGATYNIVSGGANTATLNNGTKIQNSASLPLDVSAFMTEVSCLSTDLSNATPTGSFNTSNEFFQGSNNATLEIITVDGADLNPATAFNSGYYDIDYGATLVVNVSGTSVDLNYTVRAGRVDDPTFTAFGGGPLIYKVIWNFYEATSITLHTNFQGTIIAPLANMDIKGNYNGRIYIGGDLTHSGSGSEIHNYPFTGNLSSFCNAAISTCNLAITRSYSDNCTGSDAIGYTADWNIGISVTNAPDNSISYQRNSETVLTHPLTGTTDTVTIAGIPADGGAYDTIKVWFTNETTCADTIILKRPLPCPTNVVGSTQPADVCQSVANTAIAGTVFEDWNYDGVMNQSDTIGVTGVQVYIYDDCNSVIDTTYTDANGNYQFTLLTTGTTYRIEFNLPESVACWAKPTQVGVDNGTTIQFVQPGNCASLGLAAPSAYCNTNPDVYLTCYVVGNPLSGDLAYDTLDALIGFPYNSNNNTKTGMFEAAVAKDIGSTWGLALQRNSKTVFTSSVLKRHTGLGTIDGTNTTTGGIYGIDVSNPSSASPIKWIDVNTIGINTGADPRDGSTANSVANVPTSPSFDAATFDLTGKIGIGDLDIQDDNTLWFINLNDRSLYGIKNVNPTVMPTASDILGPYPVPNPGCGSGSNDIRPWGVEVHKGKVYVGAVCSGETSQDSLDLHAWVFEFDPNAASAGMSPFFDFDINYERGRVKYWNPNASSDLGDWRAWLKESDYVSGTEAYMQPILSDIEFDNDGSMILGFIDRWGLQVERGNYRPDLTGMDTNLENQEFISAGDILRACFVNGTYVFEGGTGCNYNALNRNGPGAHEYYQDDWGGNHALEFSESTQGALLFLPGQTEVMVNQFDPYAANHEGGVRTLNNTTGSVVNKFLVYDTNVPGNFGKGQGLGDFDALCDPAPLEIGNYVWLDTDADGIQNACEPALDSVIVTLYNTACEIIAIDTTDSKGEYYFNETKLREYTAQTDSILSPNTTYYVVITDAVGGAWTTADSTLTIGTNNYNLTINNQGSNDLIDSDATKGTATSACNSVTNGYAFATAITGDAGCVDHSFDIGFRTIASCAEINQLITNRIICSGDLVDTLAITTTFTNPDSIAFVYFDSIQTVAASIYANGKGLDTLHINNDNDTVRLTNVSGFTNTSTITDTFYVYVIAHPTPTDNTCRPYEEILVIVNPLPSVSAFAIQPSCDNGSVQTDGYLQISAFTNTDRFNWVVGSNYIADGGDPDYADAMTIGALPYQFNMGIANPIGSQNYTIRAFNGTTGCFQDYTITMNQQDCSVGCNCTENIYLNETTTGGSVHKYEINTDGSLSEIGSPWYDNVAAGDQLTSPHGLASDLNGFLYIGESTTASEIRRFTCDGEIIPESEFAISTAGQFNIGSIGNTLYVGERDFAGIVAYDLCTGTEVSRLQFCENTGNLAGNWGFFIDPVTQKMYATNSQTPWVANRVWSFDESQFTADGLPCISNIDTIRNDANSPLRDARFMGITTDTAENIYIVVDDDTNYSGSPSYVLKYGPAPFHPFIAISSLDSLADGTGFNDAHAIVYSETSDRIYVSTNSAFDDCVAIFDTDLNYLEAAVPSPGDGSQAKGMTILKECCPTNNNVTIDTTLCASSLNDSLFLQELISCNGIICEGIWKAGDANVGLTYDSCNHSITITALNACGSFTLESDGVNGNLKCGAFKVTVNIGVGDITAPIIAGNQTVCNGDDPTAFTITTAASGSNAITYQWQSTTDTLAGYTDIPSATNATYDPPTGITDTTYYRVIAAVAGGCSSDNCQDTSNVIIVTVEDCPCEVNITNFYTENCSGTTSFTTDLKVIVSWSGEPVGEDINVSYDGANTQTIPVSTTGTSPDTVSITIPADGTKNHQIIASFVTTTGCADTIDYFAPLPCPPDVATCSGPATGVGGNIFEDFNYDGTDAGITEPGIPGIKVYAYDCDGNKVDSAWTDADGDYLLNTTGNGGGLTAGGQYRIEFELPENIACWGEPTLSGANNGTTVQFVTEPTCASLGIANPVDYCQTNPEIFNTCYAIGDPTVDGSFPQTIPVLINYNYESTGRNSAFKNVLGNGGNLGTVWGLAYHPVTKKVYASSALRRHVDFGASGSGGIYEIDVTDLSSPVVIPWTTVANSGTLPARDLPTTQPLSQDSVAYTEVGKMSLGDLDISEDGKTLYVMNLNDNGTLLAYDIATKTVITSYPVTDPGCSAASDVRPWGVKVYKGGVYIGVVCSEEAAGGNSNDLNAFVMKLDTTTNSFDITVTIPLNYSRDDVVNSGVDCNGIGNWNRWDSDATNFDGFACSVNSNIKTIIHPQPILSDIEFDDDGAIIIGLMDRLSIMGGADNLAPDTTIMGTDTLYNVFSGGDILRICKVGDNYVVEGSTGCAYNGGQSGLTEFYQGDLFTQGTGPAVNLHSEIATGALAIRHGSGEVITTAFDPLNDDVSDNSYFAKQGVRWLSNTDGTMLDAYEVVGASDYPFFGKATGLGDLELMCDPAPLEIGNYVWVDTDEDGIQDACEPALDSVIVKLYNAQGELVAIDTTNSKGEYYFNDTNISEYTSHGDTTLKADSTYFVVIMGAIDSMFANNVLTIGDQEYELTTKDGIESGHSNSDLIDSDGMLGDGSAPIAAANGMPFTTVITGSAGTVNHSLDFGFKPIIKACPNLTLNLGQDTICGGRMVNINLSVDHDGGEISVYVSTTKYDTAQIYAGNATFWKDTLTDLGIVINEVFYSNSGSTDTLELLNAGASTIDISTYFLCHKFSYGALNTLTLVSGNLAAFAPGEKVVLSGFNLDDSASDVGLYSNNSDFNNAANMVDFMQYGSAGNGRESVANTKGIWTMGDFVNIGAYAVNSSISYDCYGDNSSDWAEDVTPSWGIANDNKQTTVPITMDTTLAVAGTYYFYAALSNANPNTSANCQPMAIDSIIINSCDWGDLPDTSANTLMSDYQTTAANNGPVHIIIPGLKLGALVDSESNGTPDTLALGDNNDISNDEEGVTIFPSINIVPGGIIRLPLVVMNSTGDTAYIEAWIDWNGDGDFEDANEMVADLKDNHDGVFPISMNIIVPIDALTGSLLGFRVRLSNTDNMTPYGQMNSGEVEDYLLGIDCPQVICLPANIEILKKE